MATTSREASHIAKYDGLNYSLWKLGLWVLLEEHNLIQIVTGEETLPEEVLVAIICCTRLKQFHMKFFFKLVAIKYCT